MRCQRILKAEGKQEMSKKYREVQCVEFEGNKQEE